MKISYALPEFDSLAPEEIRMRQEALLRSQLDYCYSHSSWYRERFAAHGLHPADIVTLDDLRRMPILMTKDDERLSAEASREKLGHPFGMHLCAPLSDLYMTGTTSGTTGSPTFTYTFSNSDMDRMAVAIGHRFRVAGVVPGDRLMFCFSLGIYATTMSLPGIRRAGALPIDIDARAGTETMLRMAEITRPNWLACTPSLAEYLALKAPEVIGKHVGELGLKGLFLTGESWANVPELKRRIEDAYGCRAFDYWTPAGHACAISCDDEAYHGLHGIAPHLCTSFQDLVDPLTKKPIPIVDGAIGELVHTSLQREACPVVKYAYGDIAQIFLGECPGCGFSGPRIKVLGRADDMLIVKGVNVYPAAIKSAISRFIPDITGDMRIVLDSPPPRIRPPLKLKLEHGEAVPVERLPALAGQIASALHDRLRINPSIEFVPPGTFEKSTRKTPFFEKNY